MSKLRLGVIGVGHLGKEHARILAGMPDVELVGVVDQRTAQAAQVAERCGTPRLLGSCASSQSRRCRRVGCADSAPPCGGASSFCNAVFRF